MLRFIHFGSWVRHKAGYNLERATVHTRATNHTYEQLRSGSSANPDVFGLGEEARVPTQEQHANTSEKGALDRPGDLSQDLLAVRPQG